MSGPTGGWAAASGGERHDEPTAGDRPSAMGRCLSESLFGFACVGHRGAEWCHTGRKLRRRDMVLR